MPHATLKNAMADAAHLMTVEEWGALDEDDDRELEDGVLVEGEMTNLLHELVVKWLVVLLSGYFDPKGGFVCGSGIGIVIGPRRGRIPDVVCFAPGKRPEPRGVVRVPPDVIVEVISPDQLQHVRRDRIQKPIDYAKIGVRYYWLVDPEARTFEIWELGDDERYARACAATEGAIDSIPGCPGLVVNLDALWAELDRLLNAQ
jgi:Uma2 family endonuclease